MSNKIPSPTVEAWRLSWLDEDLIWREDWRVALDQQEQLAEQARKARARQDRAYFGQAVWGVSKEQRESITKADLLQNYALPHFESEQALAEWFGISLSKLRWLSHDKLADTVYHYVRFTRPKKSGGERLILAPKKELKAIQRKILAEILEKVPQSPYAHGFIRGHSILSNAQPHVGKAIVINIDLKDFFPSINFARVRGIFIKLGYSYAIASSLALLCTERERLPYERGKQLFYLGIGERMLIQGAPTSPLLANLIAQNLDKRLAGLAKKYQFSYSRYADDLSFSGDNPEVAKLIIQFASKIIREEGFAANPKKIHLFRRSNRQTVTGVVVNEKLATRRNLRRQLRAVLHNAQKTGLAAQNRAGHPHFRAYLQGMIAFVSQVNEAHGKELAEMLKQIPDA